MSASPASTYPPDPFFRRAWWLLLRFFCMVYVKLCYRLRAVDAHHVPARGPVLLVVNHQSFLDPVIAGVGTNRMFASMARSSLFIPGFGWLIHSLNAIPIERGAVDMKAMRLCLDALKSGRALLVFPEGTRTFDGHVKDFAPGTILLLKRSAPVVVPVAIEGAYAVWPKERKFPRLSGRLAVQYGAPIPAETLLAMPADQALAMLRDQVETMRLNLQSQISPASRT